MGKNRLGAMIVALLVPLLVGGLSAFLSADGMALYAGMEKPPLSPPPWVFSVAWTILYLMMGRASYFIFVSENSGRNKSVAIALYLLQLVMNFMWAIIFFNWGNYLFALIWLIVLLCVVILCTQAFYKVSKGAAYMMIPYCLWLVFATYLNLGTYILNKG